MNCPSCGQDLPFRSERAPYAVCSACDTMVLRKDMQLEALGKVAECQADGTPLQLYTQGSADGKAFTVIGRIQLTYGEGFWNEWYLQYSDGSEGWLGEAMGQYFLSQIQAVDNPNDFQEARLRLGHTAYLQDNSFTVLDRKLVQIASFEGELPFVAAVGRPFLTVDLRSGDGQGLTVDNSSSPPTVYLGRWRQFADFAFSGLRTSFDTGVAVPASEVRKVVCTACGAPHELATGPQSRMLVCAYCGSAMDTSHPELVALGTVIQQAKELAKSATLPLGTEAHLPEAVYRVIGFVESATEVSGIRYVWTEYLLYNHLTGYRWLSENQGHFTLFAQLEGVPTNRYSEPAGFPEVQPLRSGGKDFRHFQTSKVVIRRVVGEFYWRVAAGHLSTSHDYICPPYVLSASQAIDDITWSLGRYLSRAELQTIFPTVTDFGRPRGIAANQPNAYSDALAAMRVPMLAGLLAAFVLIWSGIFLPGAKTLIAGQKVAVTGNGVVLETDLPVSAGSAKSDIEITLSSSDLKDRFSDLYVSVDGQRSKQVRQVVTLFSLGEKAKTSGSMTLLGVPSGKRTLIVKASNGPAGQPPSLRASEKGGPQAPTLYTLEVTAKTLPTKPAWSGLFLFILLLGLPPFLVFKKSSAFETARWYESDHG